MVAVALFDLDNTLIDRQSAHQRWAASFVEKHGLDPDAAQWFCEVDDDGFARREEVFVAARERWAIVESTEVLLAEYRRTFPELFSPDPEVLEALGRLHRAEWRMGVVTNGPSTQHVKLERSGLDGVVDAFCVSDEIGAAKPDPKIFEEAVARCRGDARSEGPVVMVGDAPVADIGGGLALGYRTIWMHRGRSWPLSEYTPDASVATVAGAVDVMLLDWDMA